jgi:hypothetical protein
MSQAALDIALGLSTILNADAGAGGVKTLATGGIFQMEAPQGTVTPYVIINQHTGQADFTLKSLANDDMLWLVKVIGSFTEADGTSGLDGARTINARIDTVLSDPTLSVSAGKHFLSCRREMDIAPYKDDFWDNGQVFVHIGALYRVQVANG